MIVNLRHSTLGGARATNVRAWRASVERFADLVSTEQCEAWIDQASAICHPDLEWDLAEFAGPPNIPILLFGIDAVQSFWREWLRDWVPLGLNYDVVDTGNRAVLLVERERFRARSTGDLVTIGPYAQLATWEDGLMVSWKAYASQARALEIAWG